MRHTMGIIGYGGMANWHHKNIKARVPGLEVAAAYDIDPARLDLVSKNGLRVHKTLEAFLKDGADVVLVATPNQFHKPLTIAALEAGKHVICEKPVALSVAEFDAMCAAAARSGRFFCVHQNRRWDTDYRMVKKTIRDGVIGRPYTIESRVQGGKGVMHGWRGDPEAGGGMLLDWGVHMIDQMLQLIPEPVVRVDCHLHDVKCRVDDYFKLVLRFESGITAQIEVGIYHYIKLPRWYVCGDKGDIQIDDWDLKGKVICAKKLEPRWDDSIAQTAAGPTRTMAPVSEDAFEVLPLPQVETDWADFYNNAMDCMEGKAEQFIKQAESRRVLQVIEAAFASDRDGCSVTGRI